MRFSTLIVLLLALALPSAALAQGEDVIRDCAQDGDLDGNYTQDELDEAYDNMPSDIDEYSNCREVIEKARERNDAGGNNDAGSDPADGGSGDGGAGAGGSGDDASGDFGGSGNDREELREREENAGSDDAPEGAVAGENLSNSGGSLGSDDDSGGMPAALILALVLLALAGIGGLMYLFRDELPESIASRLPGPPRG